MIFLPDRLPLTFALSLFIPPLKPLLLVDIIER